jgi:hypothetical protein
MNGDGSNKKLERMPTLEKDKQSLDEQKRKVIMKAALKYKVHERGHQIFKEDKKYLRALNKQVNK